MGIENKSLPPLPEKNISGDEISEIRLVQTDEFLKNQQLEIIAKVKENQEITEIRDFLNPEYTEKSSVMVATTGTEITDFDQALTMLVLKDNPDRIVDDILKQIPEGFTPQDNNLGEVALSIRIWLTESAGNAIRHIGYRYNGINDITYEVDIFSKILVANDGRQFLEIDIQDNGIGIKPEILDIIGTKPFTTSKEHKQTAGTIWAGGHGRFSFYFKTETANPRGWKMRIENRTDGESGAISSLIIPLRKDI